MQITHLLSDKVSPAWIYSNVCIPLCRGRVILSVKWYYQFLNKWEITHSQLLHHGLHLSWITQSHQSRSYRCHTQNNYIKLFGSHLKRLLLHNLTSIANKTWNSASLLMSWHQQGAGDLWTLMLIILICYFNHSGYLFIGISMALITIASVCFTTSLQAKGSIIPILQRGNGNIDSVLPMPTHTIYGRKSPDSLACVLSRNPSFLPFIRSLSYLPFIRS